MTDKMRLIVMGQQAFGKDALAKLLDEGRDEVVAVYCEPDRPGKPVDPIKEFALEKGLPEQAPFDVIYVAGMIETLPEAWAGQLREGGRLAAVVADGSIGRGKVFTKAGTTLSAREGFDACPPRFTAFDRKPSFSF